MAFEKTPFGHEEKADIEVASQYNDFIPSEFVNDPIQYFETHGINMKDGDVLKDESGRVREDPTAVKELPEWINGQGEKLAVIAKKVNIEKGKIKKFDDPFYEYKMMKIALAAGLPAAEPIATVSTENAYLIVMKKLNGISGHEQGMKKLIEQGFSDEDIINVQAQAELMMNELGEKFEAQGIKRKWELKDMVIDIDFSNKQVKSVTPIDWEKTKIEE